MQTPGGFDRILLLVLDGVGVGAMPDAAAYGDEGSDTLGHVLAAAPVPLPALASLGLARIRSLPWLDPLPTPRGAWGKSALRTQGKDTTAGHWEMAGVVLARGFRTFPAGFPRELVAELERRIGRATLGNVAASGTEIVARLGAEHIASGAPILYTSADSVLQLAAHEEVVPVERLYEMCQAARALLDEGGWDVGRVIARPFTGNAERGFTRTRRRHDFATPPPSPMLLDQLAAAGIGVHSVGKIRDIFCGRGIAAHEDIQSNADGLEKTLAAMDAPTSASGLVFVNLVDFDMLFGHRNDAAGFAGALAEFDAALARLLTRVGTATARGRRHLLLITADHGCDPAMPSTDHSREYVPLLAYAAGLEPRDLGTRASLADIGQTIAANFGLTLQRGRSFLGELRTATIAD